MSKKSLIPIGIGLAAGVLFYFTQKSLFSTPDVSSEEKMIDEDFMNHTEDISETDNSDNTDVEGSVEENQ